jgi:predicted nucleic acid-binding protein
MLQDTVDLQEAMLDAGMIRKPLPDLIITAVAQAHDAVLVHHDKDFDDIAKITGDLRAHPRIHVSACKWD